MKRRFADDKHCFSTSQKLLRMNSDYREGGIMYGCLGNRVLCIMDHERNTPPALIYIHHNTDRLKFSFPGPHCEYVLIVQNS